MGFLADDKIECFFLSEEFNTGFFLLAVKIELLVLVAVVFVVLLEANEPELTLILELELEFEFGFCQLEKKSSTLFSLEFDLEASESVSRRISVVLAIQHQSRWVQLHILLDLLV